MENSDSSQSDIPSIENSPENSAIGNWDTLTAYKLNLKLQQKYKKLSDILDKSLKKNKNFQIELSKLSLTDIENKINAALKSNEGILSNPGFIFDSLLSEKSSDLDSFSNQLVKFRKNRKENSISENPENIQRYSDVLFDKTQIDPDSSQKLKPVFKMHTKAKKWTLLEKKNLALGVRHLNKQILINKILDSTELSPTEKKKNIELVNKLKSKPLEVNIDGLDWKEISRVFVPTQKPSACAIQWATHGHPIINKKPWSENEITELNKLATEHQERDWVLIASKLNTNRTAQQCFKMYQRKINSKLALSKWTKKEDELLKSLVAQYGEGNWQTISSFFIGRTGQQILHRWYKSVNPNLKSGKWKPEEDTRLMVGVSIFGVGRWNKICQFVPGRTDVKCRERYVNVLAPNLNRGKWTPLEDYKLAKAVCEVGLGKWSTVAEMVGNRTDSQCWKHWATLEKRGVKIVTVPNADDSISRTLKFPRLDGALEATQTSTEVDSLDNLSNINNSDDFTTASTEKNIKRYKQHPDLEGIDQESSKKRRWKRFDSSNYFESSVDAMAEDISDSELFFFQNSKKPKNSATAASEALLHMSSLVNNPNGPETLEPEVAKQLSMFRKILSSTASKSIENDKNITSSQNNYPFTSIVNRHTDAYSMNKAAEHDEDDKSSEDDAETNQSYDFSDSIIISNLLKKRNTIDKIDWMEFLQLEDSSKSILFGTNVASLYTDDCEKQTMENNSSGGFIEVDKTKIGQNKEIANSEGLKLLEFKNLLNETPIPPNLITTKALLTLLEKFPELLTAFNSGITGEEYSIDSSSSVAGSSSIGTDSSNSTLNLEDKEYLYLENVLKNVFMWPLLLGSSLNFKK
ncbi:Myb-like protein L [Smittium culicis]|uniref:Myb-like protein L n=1 Tax=Smittium culicis TaxID=133412 RepID=A0A1R1X0W6_9FUNG|nr:Myb-like protein L [Smittium culicis]